MLSKDLLSGAQGAADYLGLTTRAIYHLVEHDLLPVIRLGTARLYFRKSDLEKLFTSRASERSPASSRCSSDFLLELHSDDNR